MLMALGAWADWHDGLDRIPSHRVIGSDYVVVTTYGDSYITYSAPDKDTRATLRADALTLAKWCCIPASRVIESTPYHGKPSLQIIFKPWKLPFDRHRPANKPDHYRILIDLRGVVIQGTDDEGIRRGVALLEHMLRHSAGMGLQRMAIDDSLDPGPATNRAKRKVVSQDKARKEQAKRQPAKSPSKTARRFDEASTDKK